MNSLIAVQAAIKLRLISLPIFGFSSANVENVFLLAASVYSELFCHKTVDSSRIDPNV